MSLTDLLFPMADIAFDFWPVILAGSIVRARRGLLRVAVVIWVFLAAMRAFLLLNPRPLEKSLLIAEPLSTYLFLAVGAVLLVWIAGRAFWRQAGFRRKTGVIRTAEDLHQLSASEFEEMVAALYRALGHDAKRTGSIGDHGVDVVVRASNGEKWVAQCKRWRTPVGEPVVRDFYGVMQHEKADQGAIITAGGFTPQAREWAHGKPIILYDGKEFLHAWKRAKVKENTPAPTAAIADAPQNSPGSATQHTTAPPLCPRCGIPMVTRTARRGEHQGKQFYGCPNYPRCREIVAIALQTNGFAPKPDAW